MIGTALSAVLLLMGSASGHPAVAEGPPILAATAAPTNEVRGEAMLKLLKAHYVHPQDVAKAENAIRRLAARHADRDDETFAKAIGPKLSALLRDRHLLLEYRARPVRDRSQAPSAAPDAAAKAKMEEFARRVNFGLTEIKVLDGNIGYLRVDGFMPPDVAGPALADAMASLRRTRGLVIDLRESVNGGDPRMVALFCAYFVPDSGRLLTTIAWRHKSAQESRIPGLASTEIYSPNAPVYVLTSRKTFSAGEELAYNLKALKRARLIGERTGGGANPGSDYRVSDHLLLFIPEGQAINAITGTNWNWTGVVPDEQVAPAKALDRALQLLAVR